MKHTAGDRWPDLEYLGQHIAGREDPPEVVEQCLRHFGFRETAEHAVPRAPGSGPAKARAAVANAKVRLAVQGTGRGADLERQLTEARAAVDRLLAFVPVRANVLPGERLEAAAREVQEAIRREYAQVTLIRTVLADEHDPDSSARHRLHVIFEADPQADTEILARAVQEAHRTLAQALEVDEFESVNLIVEPEFAPLHES